MTEPSSYRRLDPDQIIATCDRLSRRIRERFPTRRLAKVADELIATAQSAKADTRWLQRPHTPVRIAVALILIVVPLAAVYGAIVVGMSEERKFFDTFHNFIQVAEPTIASLVFLGAAVAFLLGLERRVKRERVLVRLHEVRALAHIVDMHQLPKDPERLKGRSTKSSPPRTLTPFELGRYLDYCSELQSLISKVAAVYGQSTQDPGVGAAVDEIESLTTGLSRKIWQKIMLLHQMYPEDAGGTAAENA